MPCVKHNCRCKYTDDVLVPLIWLTLSLILIMIIGSIYLHSYLNFYLPWNQSLSNQTLSMYPTLTNPATLQIINISSYISHDPLRKPGLQYFFVGYWDLILVNRSDLGVICHIDRNE